MCLFSVSTRLYECTVRLVQLRDELNIVALGFSIDRSLSDLHKLAVYIKIVRLYLEVRRSISLSSIAIGPAVSRLSSN